MSNHDRQRRPRSSDRSSNRREQGLFMGGIRLGRAFGVNLVADWSLLIIFALIAVNLGLGVLPYWHPEWSALLTWTVALGASVLFFGSVLLHELSHAIVANRNGIPVRRITLFIFGGMAHMEREPPSAGAEFKMAVVGPITSIVIGVVATAGGLALAADAIAAADGVMGDALRDIGPVATLLLWLGPINLLLGVFNMVPGFPLDGGRVLRSALWAATGDLVKSTRWASNAGRAFAWTLIGLGVFMLFGGLVPGLGGGPIQGLWLVIIGWFLNNAARASYEQLLLSEALSGVSVADLMRARAETVGPDMGVATLVQDHIMRSDQHGFPVLEGDRVVGLVTLNDVRRVPRSDWERVRVSEIMTPSGELVVLSPDDDAMIALRELSTRDLNQLPVMEHDRLRGLIRREDLMRWLSLRSPSAAGT